MQVQYWGGGGQSNDRQDFLEGSTGRKQAERRVAHLKYQLMNLGFTEKAYSDLSQMVGSGKEYIQKLAARELAVWHTNQRSREDAVKALSYLSLITKGFSDPDIKRQSAILEAECLALLGDLQAAKQVIFEILKTDTHIDLFLELANFELELEKRMEWINKALVKFGLSPVSVVVNANSSLYDTLHVSEIKHIDTREMPKVSVIIPAYNAENTIRTTLDSVLSQTWSNIEVLVVDDCSKDKTAEIVMEYEQNDSRVSLLQTEFNGGPYIARNIALRQAKGDFVTCNDSDDWSHPQKIEKQVQHLMENPEVVANTSQQARATPNLEIYRRGNYGYLMFENMSSLMFRKDEIIRKIGYWDSVRFAADNEFIRRIKKVFGKEAVVYLQTGPLSFQRQSDASLTSNSAFGYHGYFMGARLEYLNSHNHFHGSAKKIYIDFPLKERGFAVPEPMWPKREIKQEQQYRHFDIVIVSDFRLDESERLLSLDSIRLNKEGRIGLVQMSSYDVDFKKKRNPRIRKLIDSGKLQMLVYGEKISCNLLIVGPVEVLTEKQRFIPSIRTKEIEVVSVNGIKYDKNSVGYSILEEYVELIQV